MSDRTPRRWLTFSLRSLFVLVLIAAAYFAGWRSATWTAEREKDAAARKTVEELREKAEPENGARGGLVGQPEVYVIPEIDSVVLTGPPDQAERVRRFLEMQKLFGKAPFGSKGSFAGNSGDTDDFPPPRSPQEKP